ncbi:MAG: hypothetical protein ACRD29_09750 [Acidimicrobiales bacterium]
MFTSAVMLVFAGIDVQPAGVSQAAEPTTDTDGQRDPVPIDEVFARIGSEVPQFAGVHIDGNGDLAIHMVGRTPDASIAYRSLLDHFGAAMFADGPPRLVAAEYTFRELKQWHDEVSVRLLALPGITLTDIDESRNRIVVGLADEGATELARIEVDRLGVPNAAVVMEVVGEFGLELRDHYRPLHGGQQIVNEAARICSLGFNAIRNGIGGFVTNSHCTRVFGQLEVLDSDNQTWEI